MKIKIPSPAEEYDVGIERDGKFIPLYRKIAMPAQTFYKVMGIAFFLGLVIGVMVMSFICAYHVIADKRGC